MVNRLGCGERTPKERAEFEAKFEKWKIKKIARDAKSR